MRSPADVRHGSQTPRLECYPLYATTAGDDAVDVAAAANLTMDPWQEYVLRRSLGEKPDSRWSAFRVGLIVPRQNGKNVIVEARELAGLLLFGERVIIHTAHEFKTAHKSMVDLMNRIRLSPLVEYVKGYEGGQVEDIRDLDGFKTGNFPSITMKNGNQVQYAARSAGSGRGFTGDLIVLDEAYALRSAERAALVPTLAAKSMFGNPQVWFTSSAGMPASDLLASLREEGIAKADRLAFFEWSALESADSEDVDAWYEANPGLGYRISEDYIRDELVSFQADADGVEAFRRERLGIWARVGGETVWSMDLWNDLADPDSKPASRLVFAVDVAPSRESASISCVSIRPDGITHVEVVDHDLGTAWLSSRLKELIAKWHPAGMFAIAGSATESLVAEWKRDGVRVHLLRFAEYRQACGLLFDLVAQGKIAHLGDKDVLDTAVEGARQQWTSDKASWYWSRKNSDCDITPLVAVTVGLAGMQKRRSHTAAVTGERVGVIL